MNKTLALLCALIFARPAFAQPPEVTRVVKSFDFEERRLGNDEDLPMHWTKVRGAGLPHYVNGRLSTDRAHGGKYSFKFELNGGGLIYRFEPGRIKVRYGAHYRIEGYCQTTVLPNARARMTAYFADQDGRPLANTTRHSELYAARKEGEPWKRLALSLTADSTAAASLVLELELLQPMHYAPSQLGERALYAQDIRGAAWFDDITVEQVPEVRLSTDRPGNIFGRSDKPLLQIAVSDRFTDDLVAQVLIRDAAGKTMYQRSGTPDMRTAEKAGDGQKHLTLDLPELPPGWYEVFLGMSSQGQPLGASKLDFIRLADDARHSKPDERFGIIATDLPFEAWPELPDLLPQLCAGRVKLALWSKYGDVEQLGSGPFDKLLERLADLGISPTACLTELPPAVAQQVRGSSFADLLRAKPDLWQPQLALLVSRHAGHLERWQVGADGSDEFATTPDMREAYKLVYGQFSELVEKPDLAMPWPAWFDLGNDLPATVALGIPTNILPAQLPLYVDDIRRYRGHNLSLALDLLDRDQYGREVQIRDVAQRVVYALAADAKRIDLPLPFAAVRDGDSIMKQPRELFMILRTLISTLSGTTFKGKVPLTEGIEAFLFDRNGQSILVLWDKGNTAGIKQLSLSLGERPVSMDLWGNVTPLVTTPGSKKTRGHGGGMVSVEVGPMPIFLVDVDGPQAQLRASVGFDRPLVESSFEPHPRHFHFTNTYATAVSGTLRLKAPPGWTLNPPTFNFTLNPGEKLDREVVIEFPYNSFAGAKTVQCEFVVQGDKSSSFTVPVTLQLGLSDVGMQTMALRDGKDVIVQQMITNYGESNIDYNAFALFPGQARQERLVTALEPGKTTLKRYRFVDVKTEPNAKVRVGLKELAGTRILNDEVAVQ